MVSYHLILTEYVIYYFGTPTIMSVSHKVCQRKLKVIELNVLRRYIKIYGKGRISNEDVRRKNVNKADDFL